MKIIALLPFKNESWILPTYISNVSKIVDEIVAIDDGSTDNSLEIMKNAGAIVFENKDISYKGWSEHNIREKLLKIGRERGGTHFVCLDADEIFDDEFTGNSKYLINKLSPGDILYFKWATLWKSLYKIRTDGVYKDLYKDFIFCDDGVMQYPYAFLGVKRTPSSENTNEIKCENSVIHFQYFNFNKNQIKQAWYRCSELLKGDRSAWRINITYDISKDGYWVKISDYKQENYGHSILPKIETIDDSSWHLQKIKQWFEEYGVEFFEPLDIWHIDELRDMFINKLNRKPSPSVYPRILIKINDLKNLIRNKIRK